MSCFKKSSHKVPNLISDFVQEMILAICGFVALPEGLLKGLNG
jgi:hypothetical protein